MIAIIDYDAGNLKSVEKALIYLGEDVVVTRDKKVLLSADKVILPGVGAFGEAMRKLKKYDLISTIHEIAAKKTPFLGICLGLQLIFEGSDEDPDCDGLSLLKGRIIKIPGDMGLKVPHIGWNSIKVNKNSRLLHHIPEDSFVYFVHSYYLQAEDEQCVAATAAYGVNIHAAVESGNIFACQFHPEKSSDVGLSILKNFAAIGR